MAAGTMISVHGCIRASALFFAHSFYTYFRVDIVLSGGHPPFSGGHVRGGIRRAQASLGQVLRHRIRCEVSP